MRVRIILYIYNSEIHKLDRGSYVKGMEGEVRVRGNWRFYCTQEHMWAAENRRSQQKQLGRRRCPSVGPYQIAFSSI